MKINSLFSGHFALTGVALATMLLVSPPVSALGLGRLAVQSGLGETLRADIEVTTLTPEEAATLQIKVAAPEAYRAAGVDYNPVLPGTRAVLQRRADGRSVLHVTSDRAVQEPFVDVIFEISWATGRLVREYTMLFDPPSTRGVTNSPAVAAAPSFSAAPVGGDPSSRAERRSAAPSRPPAPVESSAPVETRRAAAPVTAVPASQADAASGGGDRYRVRPGDSLSKIAGRVQRPGVSLDQMLTSLYQANPEAFLDNNMNRLKSGVVLSVPSAEAAKSMTTAEARQLIQAQSADFGSYRNRLAGGVQAAKVDGPSRQATGTVQADVEDGKKSTADAADTLKLTKGSTQASAADARVSNEQEKKDTATRMAELAKNVEELKRLSGASTAATSTAGAPAVPAAPAGTAAASGANFGVPVPGVVAPAASTGASTAPPVVAPAPVTTTPPVIASAPVEPPAVPASAALETPAVVTAAPAAVPNMGAASAVPAAPSRDESAVTSLLGNPLALAAGGGLLALLIGFGLYRYAKRAKNDSGETSFLESRLQPDSFFGASGGQRIDTRDAAGASSSMSYSLSQLDAIGDVDPVAEADVYLAYGRDLQAEEILKEAMRASPERLAIRTKLLEVYAKRRDTKGFELLATQLFALTNGQGDDWAKAQEIGRQIEPDNALYHPGGVPASVRAAEGGGQPAGLMGASTMPQSILPGQEFSETVNSGKTGFLPTTEPAVDLDLDLGHSDAGTKGSAKASEPPRPFSGGEAPFASSNKRFDLPPATPPASDAGAHSGAMEFDLSGISLELDNPRTEPPPRPVPSVLPSDNRTTDFGEIDLGGDSAEEEADPIVRKLELADEFRQIGDLEGARDLLQEVVAKATGAVKVRAQAMLDELG